MSNQVVNIKDKGVFTTIQILKDNF